MMFCYISILISNYAMCVFALENLALSKDVWEQNPWRGEENWRAENAVDGRYQNRSAAGGQCVISENFKKTAEWRVDLGRMFSISHINIFYRTDNLQRPTTYTKRMAGFFLYVSNTTKKEEGHLCFHEIQRVDGTPSEDQHINCSVHGRYVIYYNERNQSLTYPQFYSTAAHYELCELEVFGCSSLGYYGDNCNITCPPNCQEKMCDINTGHCLGCVPGYQGPNCNQACGKRTFGLGCTSVCGNCTKGEACNNVDGVCVNGCDKGVYGRKCQEGCQPGNYGENCGNNCSLNCNVTRRCDRFTGDCDGGCKPGWKGIRCNNECDDSSYGRNCSYSCGQCQNGVPCNKTDGRCPSGCASGYEGLYCNKTCKHKYYGLDCNLTCSTSCFNQTCDAKSGECLIDETSKGSSGQVNGEITPAAVGGSLGIVLIVTITVVVIVCRRKERQNRHPPQKQQEKVRYENTDDFSNLNESKKGSHSLASRGKTNKAFVDLPADVDTDEKIHQENPYGDMYANEQYCPDILVKDIGSVIMKKRKAEDDGFKREYASLPYGERYPCDTAKLQVNVSKNRFKTTFPYDHSRVILRKNAGSDNDYTNANYIDGHERKNEYIASQGPKESTLGDFWEMVCQDKVKQIIMLTNLREGRKLKCHQYWPDFGTKETYGTISVKSMEEKQFAFYTLRKFQVSQKAMNSYVVTQFHYTTWPDHGTPDPLCLVLFHTHVTHEHSNHDVAPILVHCSAGIGRTGTYIALDSLYQAGKKSGRVNVAEYVKTMRGNRMNMIQTYEQYMTVFLALDEAFKSVPDLQATVKFCQRVSPMLKDVPANYSGLRKEYELLRKVCPVYTKDDYKLAKQNIPKLRKDVILPLDKYGLYLTSNLPTRGSFINAIVVSSYNKENALIVTHYPPPEDAIDFLRLLTDHESSTVICMDPLHTINSSKSWLPSPSSEKIVSPYSVVYNAGKENNAKLTVISIHKEGEEPHSVTVAEPKSDLKTQNVNETSSLRSLVSFALSCPNDNPITVVSKDGASLCGVFCSVFNSIQQINMDDNIDVFTTVRQLQTRRPEFCSTQDEYGLIYKTIYDHLQATSENVYFNQ